MRILHIFTDQNYVYTKALISMFYNSDVNIDFDYLICADKTKIPHDILEIDSSHSHVFALTGSKRAQVFKINAIDGCYDYIIYHFFPNDILLNMYYLICKEKSRRIIWRIWGADLYNWKKTKGIGKGLLNWIRGNARKNIRFIIPEPMDVAEYKKQFGDSASILNGPDPKGYDKKFLDSTKTDKTGDAYAIVIGHSAVQSVNHFSVLDALSKFREENIRIILPLNYGDSSYANKVEDYAISLYGRDKVVSIRNKLTLEEYSRILWKCDACIIHSDRQIAMGNIIMCMYMGKKVFLKKDSVMWNYYKEYLSLDISDSSSIASTSYPEFIENRIDIIKNREYAMGEIEVPLIMQKWKETFELLQKDLEAK